VRTGKLFQVMGCYVVAKEMHSNYLSCAPNQYEFFEICRQVQTEPNRRITMNHTDLSTSSAAQRSLRTLI
jgi:hypothetical protein